MDYKQISEEIIALCSGVGNITSVTHCSTRLRLFTINKTKVDVEALKKIKVVLGIVYTGDELQIILGKNLIPIYNEVAKSHENSSPSSSQDKSQLNRGENEKNLTLKGEIATSLNKLLGFVSASVTPLIPGLVAGGMLKVFLLLITLVWASFEKTQTYVLLNMLADMPFYFMPIFVAYGASKKLGSTPLYAMMVSAALVYPNFFNSLKAKIQFQY